jgi:membrane-bound serine protease (ClpP class)
LLSVLANPNLALLLMMIGIYGLIFEFMSPGALVPGVAGAIALLLGLYSLAVLPLNFAGVALLLLGVGLLVAEAFVPSFGILGLGGVLAFVLGAAMLVDGDAAALGMSLPLVAGIGLAALAASILVLRLAWRTRGLRSESGSEALIGRTATVLDWAANRAEGHVLLAGERWRAVGAAGLRPGDVVRVDRVQGLSVQVSAASPASADPPFPSFPA